MVDIDYAIIIDITNKVCKKYFPHSQKADIDDYSQIIILRIIKNLARYESDKHFVNWCFLCARHTAQNILRDEKVSKKNISFTNLDETDKTAIDEWLYNKNLEKIYDLLEFSNIPISDKHFDILKNIIYSRKNYTQISLQYKISRRTVYNILKKFKREMLELIKEDNNYNVYEKTHR